MDKVRTKLARGDGLRQLVELEKRKTERNSYLLSFVGGYAQIFYISLTFIGGVLVPTYQMRYSTQQGTRGIGTDTKAGADMHQDPTLWLKQKNTNTSLLNQSKPNIIDKTINWVCCSMNDLVCLSVPFEFDRLNCFYLNYHFLLNGPKTFNAQKTSPRRTQS